MYTENKTHKAQQA